VYQIRTVNIDFFLDNYIESVKNTLCFLICCAIIRKSNLLFLIILIFFEYSSDSIRKKRINALFEPLFLFNAVYILRFIMQPAVGWSNFGTVLLAQCACSNRVEYVSLFRRFAEEFYVGKIIFESCDE